VGKQVTISVKVLDNDAGGWGRVFLQFYASNKTAVGSMVFGGAYSADNAAWQTLQHSATAPAGAAYVRAGLRLVDIPGAWDGHATLNADSWAVQVQ
jgi:hypothetical protein